jgi:hypothetical protein
MPKRKKPAIRWEPIPTASTIGRMDMLSAAAEEVVAQAIMRSDPERRQSYQESVARIEQAGTPDELLDLTSAIDSTAEPPWRRRLQAFGSEILPLVSARLKVARDLEDRDAQLATEDRLIGLLYRLGDAGAIALMECFDRLDDYAKSIASVALGLLGAQASADKLWVLYRHALRRPGKPYWVGPLWGLVDLGDPRASDAVADLLWAQRYFLELFPMAYKVGDARAVWPLLYAYLAGADDKLRENAKWALAAVAHRIGRDAMRQELTTPGRGDRMAEERRLWLADAIADLPVEEADSHFAPYFHGVGAEAFDEHEIQRLRPLTDFARSVRSRKR